MALYIYTMPQTVQGTLTATLWSVLAVILQFNVNMYQVFLMYFYEVV